MTTSISNETHSTSQIIKTIKPMVIFTIDFKHLYSALSTISPFFVDRFGRSLRFCHL